MSENAAQTLSIVVVTYNASRFLPRTISSLSAQTSSFQDVQVILVDGMSGDDTVAIARESGLFSTIIVERDCGIYDAMNKGGVIAKGRWLHFLNAGDTFATESSLAELLDRLRCSEAKWAVGRAMNLGGGARPPRLIPSVPHRWIEHAFGLQPHCHQATFVRSDVFAALGGHSLEYGTAGDFDLIMRLGMLGTPDVIDQVLIHYLGGGISDGAWSKSGSGQHKSRVERLQLNRALARVDKLWVTLSQQYLRSRIQLGAARAKLRGQRST